jgi:ribosomal protein S18 acetylase RimI-like enzyme
MGLTYFKRYRMEIDVTRPLFPWPRTPPEYTLRAWDDSLLKAHAETKLRCFCHELDANVFPALGHVDGCLKLMREITRRDRFVAEATWLVQFQHPANGRSEYCGTIQGVRKGKGAGAVQNVGIVPEHRGRGLGTYLLRRALEGFRDAGYGLVNLEVTANNLGAQRLYRRLGFRRVKTVYKTAEVAYA